MNSLPDNFRRLPLIEKRRLLAKLYDFPFHDGVDETLALADVMVESAVGYNSTALGIATGFLIDGRYVDIPMATEEPSVIMAASYAATIVAHTGGVTTQAEPPLMGAQIFLENVSEQAATMLDAQQDKILQKIGEMQSTLRLRHSPARLNMYRLADSELFCVMFEIDVGDTMGANKLNTTAEALTPLLEHLSGGTSLMAIISNAAEHRRAEAQFRIPVESLKRGPWSGLAAGRRIVLASQAANEDSRRAVTHNKGILNGMTAVALATGNDTRALEAAVHSYAARNGRYRGLANYHLKDDFLLARLKAPAPLGIVGGSIGLHPISAAVLRMLGVKEATHLSRIVVALGLIQNFAALWALVTDGIQKGHMRYHARRLAWKVGARTTEIGWIARQMVHRNRINLNEAQQLLTTLQKQQG